MTTAACFFEPFDTWFFRESRPQGAVGSSELSSVFPPPPRTLAGALRTTVGDAFHAKHGSNWRQFAQLDALKAVIGFGDDLGPLSFRGPFLWHNNERLYPAPATLLAEKTRKGRDGKEKDPNYFLLAPGKDAVRCDLGYVHLPAIQATTTRQAAEGAKPATGHWLTQRGLEALLRGEPPATTDVIGSGKLFCSEARLGIGRDNARRGVVEGLLYQTRHLRLAEGVAIELQCEGLASDALPAKNAICRLGGEGRLSSLTVRTDTKKLPAMPAVSSRRFALYLLTPMAVSQEGAAGIPDGFHPARHDGTDVWEGELSGVRLRIWSVACERVSREGGWDLLNHQSRLVQSFLPAGAVLFVELIDGDPAVELKKIHGNCHGPEARMGRGLLAVGLWKD